MESGWIYLLSGLRDLGRSGICHHAMGSAASDWRIPDDPDDSGPSCDLDPQRDPDPGCRGNSVHPVRKKPEDPPWQGVDSWLTGVSSRLERRIYGWVDRRIQNAYPEAAYRRELQAEAEQRKTVFAYGLCFYKIALLLVVGAFLGDIVETIFCRLTAGIWMSRSSFVWGPFSIVWGVALAAATMLLYRYRKYSDRFLFFMGTFLGGAYEYTCSVMTEIMFGKVFWDYSKIPFNLGGRINLLYCFFWGIAAVVWIKGVYPVMSAWIEKIPIRFGKIATWLLLVFFCVDMAVSGLALIRSSEREKGIPATSSWQQEMDEHYGDDVLKKIYPNALKVD